MVIRHAMVFCAVLLLLFFGWCVGRCRRSISDIFDLMKKAAVIRWLHYASLPFLSTRIDIDLSSDSEEIDKFEVEIDGT